MMRETPIKKAENKRGTIPKANHQTGEERPRAAMETPLTHKSNLDSSKMISHSISMRFLLALIAAFAALAIPARSQDVAVTGFLSFAPAVNGTFDYTLTLQNTGSEAIEGLWLGWALSSNPVFNVDDPTNAGNALGWASPVDGNSVQFGGSPSETFLATGRSTTFTFDSTSTPAQFMSQAAGQSVAYGVDASQFAIEDDTLHSVEFAPTVVSVPEPSAISLLVAGALGILCLRWPRQFRAFQFLNSNSRRVVVCRY
jgi:hypothetical protein